MTFAPAVAASGTLPTYVRVDGLSSAELASLDPAHFNQASWPALFSVVVVPARLDASAPESSAAIPIAGSFDLSHDDLRFSPAFPFDRGRAYAARFDPSHLPVPRSNAAVIRVTVRMPAPELMPPTSVVRMLPSDDVLPENLLRVYLEFSGPMAREHGRDFLKLLDERGQEVKDAFLALDIDFWSPDGRRYTVFLDPGRVKRGILPNDQLGRALKVGHRYTLVVDPAWRDAAGQRLASGFSRTFSVGAADMTPIQLDGWQIHPPAAGTRGPVIATFPKPLDHGLLQRAIGVARTGRTLEGGIAIGPREMEWRFTPKDAWTPGTFDLVVLSILEDPMGNKIGHPFDVDSFTEIDKTATPKRMTKAFVVK